MTKQELIDYYASLLIMQYQGKPKAYATTQALAEVAIIDKLPLDIQSAFNLETAQGEQLDFIAAYQGVERVTGTVNGIITLDDDGLRNLIKFAVIRNTFGSSLSEIQELLARFFPDKVFVFDYKNMRMSYYLDSDLGSNDFISIIIAQGLLPKPMGVALSSTVYASTIDSFFGFRTYPVPAFRASPFNTYALYESTYPWLLYGYGIYPYVALDSSAFPSIITSETGDEIATEDGDPIYTG